MFVAGEIMKGQLPFTSDAMTIFVMVVIIVVIILIFTRILGGG